MLRPEYETWARQAAPYFAEAYGLAGDFAVNISRLYIVLWSKGLNPRVTSGFRDPAKQAALRAQWDAGNRAGLRARPAASSLHTATDWLGRPAARAIDIVTTNEKLAADTARDLGVGAGLYFSQPDPGHYYTS